MNENLSDSGFLSSKKSFSESDMEDLTLETPSFSSSSSSPTNLTASSFDASPKERVLKVGGQSIYDSDSSIETHGLRVVPRSVWESMLAIVKCQVLSVIHNDHVDAYLLR